MEAGDLTQFHFIIPTFNPGSLALSCISSIKSLMPDSKITVVDNSSSDDSLNLISSNFSDVEIIQNEDNFGFGAACNRGARDSASDFLIFIISGLMVSC